jgi:hypothetical protein
MQVEQWDIKNPWMTSESVFNSKLPLIEKDLTPTILFNAEDSPPPLHWRGAAVSPTIGLKAGVR